MKRSGTRNRNNRSESAPVLTARWDGTLLDNKDLVEGLTKEQIRKIIERLGGLGKAIRFSEGD